MNIVRPIIKDSKVIEIEEYLKANNTRDYLLFLCGITTGLRISDILKLRVKDLLYQDTLYITEQKTNKQKEIAISNKLKKEVIKYCKDKPENEYIFKSREGYNQPIGRNRAYKILHNAGKKCKVNNIGTHSLRKTFGRKYYQKYKDIESLRVFFNHSTITMTRRYIGVEQEIINNNVKKLWE